MRNPGTTFPDYATVPVAPSGLRHRAMMRRRVGRRRPEGEDCMPHRMYWLATTLLLMALALPASAAETVKVGVIYPLSGNAASAGNSAKDAIELGAEIVN